MFRFLPKPERRRRHTRTALRLPGQLYLLAEKSAQRCTVTDISGGGARLTCDDLPPVSAFVILTIEGFGRFEAVTANYDGETLGLRFLMSDRRRMRLLRQIGAYLNGGVHSAAVAGTLEAR